MDQGTAYQKAVRDRFVSFVDESKSLKGSQISLEVIGELLDFLSVRTFYRIYADPKCLPNILVCRDLDRFVEESRWLRGLLKPVVEGWAGSAFAQIPKEADRILQFTFNPAYLSILKSRKLSDEAKVEAMLVQVLRDWIALVKSEKEE